MYEKIKNIFSSVVSRILLNVKNKQCNPYLCILASTFLSFPIDTYGKVKLLIIICKTVDTVSIKARINTLYDLFYFLFRDLTILNQSRSRRRKLITYANYLTVFNSFRKFSKNLRVLTSQKKQKENRFYNKLIVKWRKFYYCIKQ